MDDEGYACCDALIDEERERMFAAMQRQESTTRDQWEWMTSDELELVISVVQSTIPSK